METKKRKGKSYFFAFQSEMGFGSCEIYLNNKPKNYDDIEKVAKMIENSYPEHLGLIITNWRAFD